MNAFRGQHLGLDVEVLALQLISSQTLNRDTSQGHSTWIEFSPNRGG